jgi:hypothetical protein
MVETFRLLEALTDPFDPFYIQRGNIGCFQAGDRLLGILHAPQIGIHRVHGGGKQTFRRLGSDGRAFALRIPSDQILQKEEKLILDAVNFPLVQMACALSFAQERQCILASL